MNVIVFILVDDFRSISLQLVQSHFHTAMEQGKVNRIEVLPISWHATLHGEGTGIDRKLKSITLSSIPKLRHFTNDTLLDILFYTSPVYCQVIIWPNFYTFVAFCFILCIKYRWSISIVTTQKCSLQSMNNFRSLTGSYLFWLNHKFPESIFTFVSLFSTNM